MSIVRRPFLFFFSFSNFSFQNDTAGQERFRTLTSSYYRNADALLVVYDITDQESFEEVDSLFFEATRYSSRALKFLIGNKIDLENRVISTEEGKGKCNDSTTHFFECSAKTDDTLHIFLENVAAILLERFSFFEFYNIFGVTNVYSVEELAVLNRKKKKGLSKYPKLKRRAVVVK